MDSTLLIMYGSQTGASKSIAERLFGQARAHGITCVLAPLNDYVSVGFTSARYVIVVCSTTGDGDPPNNSEE